MVLAPSYELNLPEDFLSVLRNLRGLCPVIICPGHTPCWYISFLHDDQFLSLELLNRLWGMNEQFQYFSETNHTLVEISVYDTRIAF